MAVPAVGNRCSAVESISRWAWAMANGPPSCCNLATLWQSKQVWEFVKYLEKSHGHCSSWAGNYHATVGQVGSAAVAQQAVQESGRQTKMSAPVRPVAQLALALEMPQNDEHMHSRGAPFPHPVPGPGPLPVPSCSAPCCQL